MLQGRNKYCFLALVVMLAMTPALSVWDDGTYNHRIPIYATEMSGLVNANVTISANLSLSSGFDASDVLSGCRDFVLYDAVTNQQRAFSNLTKTTPNGRVTPCYENVTFACSFTASESNKLCSYLYYNKPTATAPTTAGSIWVTTISGAAGVAGKLIEFGPMESKEVDVAGGKNGNPRNPIFGNRTGWGWYIAANDGLAQELLAAYSTAPVITHTGLFSVTIGDSDSANKFNRNLTYYDTGRVWMSTNFTSDTAFPYAEYVPDIMALSGITYKFVKANGVFTYSGLNDISTKSDLQYFGTYNQTTSEYIVVILAGNNTKVSWLYRTGSLTTTTTVANPYQPSMQWWILQGRNTTSNLQTTLDAEWKKIRSPPQVTVGAAETYAAPAQLTINEPTNITYYTSTNLVNFSRTSGWAETTTPCWVTQSGNANWRSVGNVSISYWETVTNQSGKGNNLNVSCYDSGLNLNVTKYIAWYNWHGLNLSVVSMNGTALGAWNFQFTNDTTTTVIGKSNSYLAEYKEIGRAWSTSFTFFDSMGYFKNATFTYNINDVMGFVNKTVSMYRNQEWRATSALTAAAISNFTITFWNSTQTTIRSTNTGKILAGLDDLPSGNNVQLSVLALGYNVTLATRNLNLSSSFNESFALLASALNISAWDESNPAMRITFDALFDNGTVTQSNTSNSGELYLAYEKALGGDNKLTISNSSYYPRNYFFTLTSTSAITLNTYLLPVGAPSYVLTPIVVLTTSEAPIPNALVSIQRKIGSSSTWITVAQGKTDGAGQLGSFYLDSSVSYNIKAEASGYITTNIQVNPTTTAIRVYMISSSSAPWVNVLSNITISFTPYDSGFNKTANFPVMCSISSPASALIFWGLNITWNGTSLYYEQKTDANGGIMNPGIDTRNTTGLPIFGECYYKITGFDEFNLTRSWISFNVTETNTTMTVIGKRFQTSDIGTVAKTLIYLIVAMSVASMFASVNVFIATFVFLLLLGVEIMLFGPIAGVLTWTLFFGGILFMLAVYFRGGL